MDSAVSKGTLKGLLLQFQIQVGGDPWAREELSLKTNEHDQTFVMIFLSPKSLTIFRLVAA